VSLEENVVNVYLREYVEDLGQEHMHTTKILWEKILHVSLHTEKFLRGSIYPINIFTTESLAPRGKEASPRRDLS